MTDATAEQLHEKLDERTPYAVRIVRDPALDGGPYHVEMIGLLIGSGETHEEALRDADMERLPWE